MSGDLAVIRGLSVLPACGELHIRKHWLVDNEPQQLKKILTVILFAVRFDWVKTVCLHLLSLPALPPPPLPTLLQTRQQAAGLEQRLRTGGGPTRSESSSYSSPHYNSACGSASLLIGRFGVLGLYNCVLVTYS